MPKPSEQQAANTETNDEPKAPLSVRETIQQSLKELEDVTDDNPPDEDDDKEDDDLDIEDEDPAGEGILNDDKPKKTKKAADTEAEEEVETTSEEDTDTEEDTEPVKKAKKTQIDAPDNWKGDADWDKTPASIRQKIIKREQEVSEGFKQYGSKAKEFDKYEQIIGPRRQSMAKIGVSPEQVIGRALEWMDALAHPDEGTRVNSFKLLARNFGVNVASLAGNDTSNESRVDNNNQGEVPPQLREYVSNLENQVNQLNQRLGGLAENYNSQQDRAAMSYLQNWAKDKPHFQAVQREMVVLMQSGIVPLAEDGSLDLDTAYDMAVNANPAVRQLVAAEKAKEAKKEAETKAKKEREKKQAALSKARAAGGSLKPGAPSLSNGKTDARGLSVRDAIKLSLKQLNG